MKALNVIWLFIAGFAVAAALVVARLPGGFERVGAGDAAGPATPSEAPPQQRAAAGRGHAPKETTAADAGATRPADEALRAELEAMSEGYRNRQFLHAIRKRGHYCESVASSQASRGATTAWRVGCGGVEAYLIAVDSHGELVVEPLYYADPNVLRGLPEDPSLSPDERRLRELEPRRRE